jgi:hypothetical protein
MQHIKLENFLNLFDLKFPSDMNLTFYASFNPDFRYYSEQSSNDLKFDMGCD